MLGRDLILDCWWKPSDVGSEAEKGVFWIVMKALQELLITSLAE